MRSSRMAATLTVQATSAGRQDEDEFNATVRIDTPQEILYYQNGGISAVRAAAVGEVKRGRWQRGAAAG